MKKMKFAAFVMSLLTIISCGSSAGNGALIGTGAGSAVGALAGRLIGGNGKGAVVGAAVGAAVGATTGTLIGKHMDKVKAKTAAELEKAKIEEITDANGLKAIKVTFDAGLLFGSGSSSLAAASKSELTNFASVLKGDPLCSVDIQGYSDNDPWKGMNAEQSQAKNVELSQKRADAVKGFLNGQGVTNDQIKSSTGYGEAYPVASNDTKEGKAQNRRVEVYLYASQEMIDAANAGNLE